MVRLVTGTRKQINNEADGQSSKQRQLQNNKENTYGYI